MIHNLLNQELDSISSTAFDAYGGKTLTELFTEIPCRWQEKFERILDSKGLEVVATKQCWIPPEHNGDTITVDVDYIFSYNSTQHIVIAYTNEYNLQGVIEYIKVFLR